MDPLSITVAVGSLVAATAKAADYLNKARHHKKDAHALSERFKNIQDDLESFKRLVETIIGNAPNTNAMIPDTRQRNAALYSRAKSMGVSGGDIEILTKKLEALCTKVNPDERSKIKNLMTGATWPRHKESIKEEQGDVTEYIRRMRDKLGDDHVEWQLASSNALHQRQRDKEVMAILQWVCPETLAAPLHPAPDQALENTSFVTSDPKYKQWHQDKSWQMNCHGKPGTGKVSRYDSLGRDQADW